VDSTLVKNKNDVEIRLKYSNRALRIPLLMGAGFSSWGLFNFFYKQQCLCGSREFVYQSELAFVFWIGLFFEFCIYALFRIYGSQFPTLKKDRYFSEKSGNFQD